MDGEGSASSSNEGVDKKVASDAEGHEHTGETLRVQTEKQRMHLKQIINIHGIKSLVCSLFLFLYVYYIQIEYVSCMFAIFFMIGVVNMFVHVYLSTYCFMLSIGLRYPCFLTGTVLSALYL